MTIKRLSITLALLGLFACNKNNATGQAQPQTTATTATATISSASVREPFVINIDKLSETAKQSVIDIGNTVTSPCGDAVSLVQCVRENRPCAACKLALESAADLAEHGHELIEIRAWVRARYLTEPTTIDIGDSPSIGPDNAAITIVEFVDFQCSSCARSFPLVKKIVQSDAYKDKVRLVFKHFPIKRHVFAQSASRAAYAASKQGKFWPFAEQVFARQKNLSDHELRSIAKDLKLDLAKHEKDWQSEESETRVNQDRSLGEKSFVEKTPTYFINGRKYLPKGKGQFKDAFGKWLTQEFALIEARKK